MIKYLSNRKIDCYVVKLIAIWDTHNRLFWGILTNCLSQLNFYIIFTSGKSNMVDILDGHKESFLYGDFSQEVYIKQPPRYVT